MNPLFGLLNFGWRVAGRIADHRHRHANTHPSPTDFAHKERGRTARPGSPGLPIPPAEPQLGPIWSHPTPARIDPATGRSWDPWGNLIDPGYDPRKGR